MSAARPLSSPSIESINESADTSVEVESVDCLLCGSDNHSTVLIAADRTTPIRWKFRMVRCDDCGMHFTNPRATEKSLGQFYPDDYEPYQRRTANEGLAKRWGRQLEKAVLEAHFGYPPTRSSLVNGLLAGLGLWKFPRSRQRQSWIPWRAPGRLLDFGCGANGFLLEMQAFGWQVQGIDFSEKVAKQITADTGIPVHVGTLPHADIPPGSFDCITMWNALEHVPSPRQTLQSAREALRPGGTLVVGVPHIDSWGFRTFQDDWQGLQMSRHLGHFAPETLRRALEIEGFRVLTVDQIARDGWIRRSARWSVQNGRGPKWLKWCSWKPVGIRVADWTERTRQADFIRAVAEKVE